MSPLTPDAKRLRTIIISFPLFVVTSLILYRRSYLGEEQRTIPHRTAHDHAAAGQERILGRGAGEKGFVVLPGSAASAAGGAAGPSELSAYGSEVGVDRVGSAPAAGALPRDAGAGRARAVVRPGGSGLLSTFGFGSGARGNAVDVGRDDAGERGRPA